MRNLSELKLQCEQLGIPVSASNREGKLPYIAALRNHFWGQEHPGQDLPEQIEPMLLKEWSDLSDPSELERSDGWLVQEKLDGVRALMHIVPSGVRITGRSVSTVDYRLSEFQKNLRQFSVGFDDLEGTVLDGELVCPVTCLDTGSTITTSSLQATTAILATSEEQAHALQDSHDAYIRFHAFDVLRYKGSDITSLPLDQRLDILATAIDKVTNPFLQQLPFTTKNKIAFHEEVVANGGEGTVWKKLSEPYEAGKRVLHWVKRKRSLAVRAFVSGFKPEHLPVETAIAWERSSLASMSTARASRLPGSVIGQTLIEMQ